MTLYLIEISKPLTHARERRMQVLCLVPRPVASPTEQEIVAQWPFDGTERRRQEVLRFIERWAHEYHITLGNPEMWSLDRKSTEKGGEREL